MKSTLTFFIVIKTDDMVLSLVASVKTGQVKSEGEKFIPPVNPGSATVCNDALLVIINEFPYNSKAAM